MKKKTQIQDRRKTLRVEKSLMVTPCASEYLLRGDFLTKDISEDGICLLSNEKIEIGESLKLMIHLPGQENALVATGEVVRRSETNDLKFPYILGMRFTAIDPSAYHTIRNHIHFYMAQG